MIFTSQKITKTRNFDLPKLSTIMIFMSQNPESATTKLWKKGTVAGYARSALDNNIEQKIYEYIIPKSILSILIENHSFLRDVWGLFSFISTKQAFWRNETAPLSRHIAENKILGPIPLDPHEKVNMDAESIVQNSWDFEFMVKKTF